MKISGTKTFAMIWLGQAVSLVGSGLTGFALGVHVYQKTGSIASFTLIEFLAITPIVLLSPIAGGLTDRWDKRRTLISTDLLSSIVPLILAWCLRGGDAPLWQIGAAVAMTSTLSAFQWPAFSSLTTMLVPSAQLGRAAGATELARGIAQIFSPLVAGILMTSAPVGALLVIDSATYLFSAFLLIATSGARYDGAMPERAAAASSLLQDIAGGWRYLVRTPELFGLTGFFAFINVSLGIVEICITPFVLSFASPAALGGVLWVGGIGMLLGGLLMSTWRGPRRPMFLVLAVTVVQGMLLIVAGANRSLLSITIVAFLYLFCFPISMATSHAMWLRAVPVAMQGGVLGIRRALEGGALPIAALVAGPLVELIFDPLLVGDGRITRILGSVVGDGRGIAVMYVALGALTAVVSGVALVLAPRFAAVGTAAAMEPDQDFPVMAEGVGERGRS
jgi:DHA3 family macrolide efflux protein-like MFS transporter